MLGVRMCPPGDASGQRLVGLHKTVIEHTQDSGGVWSALKQLSQCFAAVCEGVSAREHPVMPPYAE
jgi:hypothetical protein